MLGLAINNTIHQEWINTTGRNQIFNAWFDQWLIEEKIRFIKRNKLPSGVKDKIHDRYGLPRNSRDIQYICCSFNTIIKYIITEDIHFYDQKRNLKQLR